MVLKQMEAANVKPDSQTFSYLISNSDSDEDIIKVLLKLLKVLHFYSIIISPLEC